jgi:hypothetical protein
VPITTESLGGLISPNFPFVPSCSPLFPFSDPDLSRPNRTYTQTELRITPDAPRQIRTNPDLSRPIQTYPESPAPPLQRSNAPPRFFALLYPLHNAHQACRSPAPTVNRRLRRMVRQRRSTFFHIFPLSRLRGAPGSANLPRRFLKCCTRCTTRFSPKPSRSAHQHWFVVLLYLQASFPGCAPSLFQSVLILNLNLNLNLLFLPSVIRHPSSVLRLRPASCVLQFRHLPFLASATNTY